ncbi:hypothetical protein M5K25_027977 [Dendrobium thyrsiflorum]|uniref:Uncharacterized protein n=1 Tax=Dendrobium thyrsiflorum TaxID=117978 RepID=A0ABD0TVF1_DENTH
MDEYSYTFMEQSLESNLHYNTHRGLGWLVGEHRWEPPIPGSNPLYYGLASSMGQSKSGPIFILYQAKLSRNVRGIYLQIQLSLPEVIDETNP